MASRGNYDPPIKSSKITNPTTTLHTTYPMLKPFYRTDKGRQSHVTLPRGSCPQEASIKLGPARYKYRASQTGRTAIRNKRLGIVTCLFGEILKQCMIGRLNKGRRKGEGKEGEGESSQLTSSCCQVGWSAVRRRRRRRPRASGLGGGAVLAGPAAAGRGGCVV